MLRHYFQRKETKCLVGNICFCVFCYFFTVLLSANKIFFSETGKATALIRPQPDMKAYRLTSFLPANIVTGTGNYYLVPLRESPGSKQQMMPTEVRDQTVFERLAELVLFNV